MGTMSLMIVGVGGQGTLLSQPDPGQRHRQRWATDVKVSEGHGMSQRGGSVVTYVKYGDRSVFADHRPRARRTSILAFELLEAYRALPWLKQGRQGHRQHAAASTRCP